MQSLSLKALQRLFNPSLSFGNWSFTLHQVDPLRARRLRRMDTSHGPRKAAADDDLGAPTGPAVIDSKFFDDASDRQQLSKEDQHEFQSAFDHRLKTNDAFRLKWERANLGDTSGHKKQQFDCMQEVITSHKASKKTVAGRTVRVEPLRKQSTKIHLAWAKALAESMKELSTADYCNARAAKDSSDVILSKAVLSGVSTQKLAFEEIMQLAPLVTMASSGNDKKMLHLLQAMKAHIGSQNKLEQKEAAVAMLLDNKSQFSFLTITALSCGNKATANAAVDLLQTVLDTYQYGAGSARNELVNDLIENGLLDAIASQKTMPRQDAADLFETILDKCSHFNAGSVNKIKQFVTSMLADKRAASHDPNTLIANSFLNFAKAVGPGASGFEAPVAECMLHFTNPEEVVKDPDLQAMLNTGAFRTNLVLQLFNKADTVPKKQFASIMHALGVDATNFNEEFGQAGMKTISCMKSKGADLRKKEYLKAVVKTLSDATIEHFLETLLVGARHGGTVDYSDFSLVLAQFHKNEGVENGNRTLAETTFNLIKRCMQEPPIPHNLTTLKDMCFLFNAHLKQHLPAEVKSDPANRAVFAQLSKPYAALDMTRLSASHRANAAQHFHPDHLRENLGQAVAIVVDCIDSADFVALIDALHYFEQGAGALNEAEKTTAYEAVYEAISQKADELVDSPILLQRLHEVLTKETKKSGKPRLLLGYNRETSADLKFHLDLTVALAACNQYNSTAKGQPLYVDGSQSLDAVFTRHNKGKINIIAAGNDGKAFRTADSPALMATMKIAQLCEQVTTALESDTGPSALSILNAFLDSTTIDAAPVLYIPETAQNQPDAIPELRLSETLTNTLTELLNSGNEEAFNKLIDVFKHIPGAAGKLVSMIALGSCSATLKGQLPQIIKRLDTGSLASPYHLSHAERYAQKAQASSVAGLDHPWQRAFHTGTAGSAFHDDTDLIATDTSLAIELASRLQQLDEKANLSPREATQQRFIRDTLIQLSGNPELLTQSVPQYARESIVEQRDTVNAHTFLCTTSLNTNSDETFATITKIALDDQRLTEAEAANHALESVAVPGELELPELKTIQGLMKAYKKVAAMAKQGAFTGITEEEKCVKLLKEFFNTAIPSLQIKDSDLILLFADFSKLEPKLDVRTQDTLRNIRGAFVRPGLQGNTPVTIDRLLFQIRREVQRRSHGRIHHAHQPNIHANYQQIREGVLTAMGVPRQSRMHALMVRSHPGEAAFDNKTTDILSLVPANTSTQVIAQRLYFEVGAEELQIQDAAEGQRQSNGINKCLQLLAESIELDLSQVVKEAYTREDGVAFPELKLIDLIKKARVAAHKALHADPGNIKAEENLRLVNNIMKNHFSHVKKSNALRLSGFLPSSSQSLRPSPNVDVNQNTIALADNEVTIRASDATHWASHFARSHSADIGVSNQAFLGLLQANVTANESASRRINDLEADLLCTAEHLEDDLSEAELHTVAITIVRGLLAVGAAKTAPVAAIAGDAAAAAANQLDDARLNTLFKPLKDYLESRSMGMQDKRDILQDPIFRAIQQALPEVMTQVLEFNTVEEGPAVAPPNVAIAHMADGQRLLTNARLRAYYAPQETDTMENASFKLALLRSDVGKQLYFKSLASRVTKDNYEQVKAQLLYMLKHEACLRNDPNLLHTVANAGLFNNLMHVTSENFDLRLDLLNAVIDSNLLDVQYTHLQAFFNLHINTVNTNHGGAEIYSRKANFNQLAKKFFDKASAATQRQFFKSLKLHSGRFVSDDFNAVVFDANKFLLLANIAKGDGDEVTLAAQATVQMLLLKQHNQGLDFSLNKLSELKELWGHDYFSRVMQGMHKETPVLFQTNANHAINVFGTVIEPADQGNFQAWFEHFESGPVDADNKRLFNVMASTMGPSFFRQVNLKKLALKIIASGQLDDNRRQYLETVMEQLLATCSTREDMDLIDAFVHEVFTKAAQDLQEELAELDAQIQLHQANIPPRLQARRNRVNTQLGHLNGNKVELNKTIAKSLVASDNAELIALLNPGTGVLQVDGQPFGDINSADGQAFAAELLTQARNPKAFVAVMNLLTQLGMNDENFQQIRLDGENPLGIPSNHLFSRILLGADIPNTTSTFKKQVKLRSVSDYQALISTLNIAGLEMASVKTICSNVLGLNYDASTYSEDTDTYKKPSLSKGLLHDSTDKAAIADIIRTLINAVVNEHETNKASDTSPHYAQFFLESALAIVDQNIESQQAQRQVTTRARTVSVTELLSGSTAEHTAASQVKEDPATAFETVASSFHSLRDNCEALFPQAQLSDDTSPKRAALFAELQEELKQLFKGEALQANIWDDISKLETRLRQAITRRRASKALLKAAERAHRTFVRLIETTDSNPNALDGDAGYNEKVGRLIKKQLRNARQLRASQRKGESIRLDSLATLASQVTAEQLQSMHPSFFEARDFNGRTLIELIFAQGDTAKIDALCNNLKQVGLYQKCMRTKSPITSLYPMDILILHQPRRAKSTISRLAGERPHVPCHIDRAIRAFKEPSGEQQLDQATVSALVNSRLKASHTIKTYFKLEYLLNDSKLIMRAALNLDSPLGGTHNALITAETDAHMQAFEAQNDAIQAALANVNNGNVTAEGAREAVQQILQAAQHIAQVINDEQLTDDAVHLADGIDGLDIQDSRDRVDELIAHIEQAKQRKKAILMQETVNPVQIAHDADPNTYVLSNEAQAFLEQISELSPQSRMQTAATKMPFIFKLSSTDSYAFKTQVLKFALSRYRRTDDDATKRKFKHLALAFISTFKFDPENTEAESTDRLNALKALIMQELQGEHAANNIELLDLLPALYQALQPSAAVMTESNFYHADASIRNFVTAQLQHTAGLSEEQLSSLSDMSQKLATQLDNAHIGQAAAAAEQLPTSQAFLQDFIAHDNFAFIRQINTFIEARQFHKAKALINVLSSFDHNNADEAFFSQAFKQALNGVLRACLAIPQANNKKELLKTVFKAIGELSNHAEILNGAQGHVIQAEPMDENDVGGHISKDNEDNLIAMLEATKEAGLSEDQQLAALNNLRLASTNGNNYQLLLHQTKHIQLVVVGNEGNNYGPITSIQQAIQQLRSGFEAGRKYVADCRREIANGNDREGIDRPETALLVA